MDPDAATAPPSLEACTTAADEPTDPAAAVNPPSPPSHADYDAALYIPPSACSTLKPMVKLCPGLHGRSAEVSTRRNISLRALLCAETRWEIPIFQRTYCWTAEQCAAWWSDVLAASARRPHYVGEILTKRRRGDGAIVVIDGQQRLTTTVILVAALLHAVQTLRSGGVADGSGEAYVLDALASALAVHLGDASSPHDRLVPSHIDQAPFAAIVEGRVVDGAELATTTVRSPQATAYRVFGAGVKAELRRWRSGGVGAQISRLEALSSAALDGIVLTHLDVRGPASFGQLFLYVQEQTLFATPETHRRGSGSPQRGVRGVKIAAGDLARNLLLSAFAAQGRAAQEDAHRELWLKPIELAARGQGRTVSELLGAFVADVVVMDCGRSISEFEAAVERRRVAGVVDDEGLSIYARFYSYVAQIESGGGGRGGKGGAEGRLMEMTRLPDGTLTPSPDNPVGAAVDDAAVVEAATVALRELARFAAA